MAKIYVCDGCGCQFPTESSLKEMGITKRRVHSTSSFEEKLYELCPTCMEYLDSTIKEALKRKKSLKSGKITFSL